MNREEKIDAIEKAFEKLIDLEWITFNPHVQKKAVYIQIESELRKAEEEYNKRERISEMFETMETYYPGKLEEFLKIK